MGFNIESTSPYNQYMQALLTVTNPDQIDINLVVAPGVLMDKHPIMSTAIQNMCQDRGDCFAIIDPVVKGDTVKSATVAVQNFDSNYIGTYFPWCKINDQVNNKLIWVPASVPMLGAYSQNDKIGFEWYAVAGLTRGSLPNVVDVQIKLNQAQRDILYAGRVNPIASYPGQGFNAWGQKTLQRKASAFDRINVRRLLINLKKYVASASRYLVFQQNVQQKRLKFINMATPYFAMVQQQRGLYTFKIVMDETNNTPDVIDRNILKGDI